EPSAVEEYGALCRGRCDAAASDARVLSAPENARRPRRLHGRQDPRGARLRTRPVSCVDWAGECLIVAAELTKGRRHAGHAETNTLTLSTQSSQNEGSGLFGDALLTASVSSAVNIFAVRDARTSDRPIKVARPHRRHVRRDRGKIRLP